MHSTTNIIEEYLFFVKKDCITKLDTLNAYFSLLKKMDNIKNKKKIENAGLESLSEIAYTIDNISYLRKIDMDRCFDSFEFSSLKKILHIIRTDIIFLQKKYNNVYLELNESEFIDKKVIKANSYFSKSFSFIIEYAFINNRNIFFDYEIKENDIEFSLILGPSISHANEIFFDLFKKFVLTNNCKLNIGNEKNQTKIIISKKLFNVSDDPNKYPNKTIIIAEDEESYYSYLQFVLAKSEVNLIWAKNGMELIELFKESHSKIDLILVDIKMPILDGISATKIIRKMNSNIPIIAQTAFSLAEDNARILEAGCNDVVSKPLEASRLIKIFNEYFKS